MCAACACTFGTITQPSASPLFVVARLPLAPPSSARPAAGLFAGVPSFLKRSSQLPRPCRSRPFSTSEAAIQLLPPAAVDPAHSRLVQSEPCVGDTPCPSRRPTTDVEGQETPCALLRGRHSNYRLALRCTPEDHRLWEEAGFPTPGTRGPRAWACRRCSANTAAQQLRPSWTLRPCRGAPRPTKRGWAPPGTHSWVVEAVTLDDHDGGAGQDLLQVLVVLAFVQAAAQLLRRGA